MELKQAIPIIRALANGVHPETGEPIEETSVCRMPNSIKALNRALAVLVTQDEREKKRPKNAGKIWTQEEDSKICDELRQGHDFQQIATAHNRSVAGILARLVKLGKISPDKSSRSLPPKVA